MLEISKHINSLLFEHNCVILPGFGAIIAQPRAVQANKVLKRLEPATKVLAFNPSLHTGDGLLVQTYATASSQSYTQSEVQVQAYVHHLKQSLHNSKKAEISGVGNFYLTQDEKILFVPSANSGFEKASYGLIPVRIPEQNSGIPQVQQEHHAEVITREEIREIRPAIRLSDLKPGKNKRPVRALYVWMASIALIGSLGGTSAVVVHQAGWTSDLFNWKRWIGKAEPTETVIPAAAPAPAPAVVETFVPAPPSDTQTISTEAPETIVNNEVQPESTLESVTGSTPVSTPAEAKATPNADPTTASTYFIIAGCFRQEANAQKMIRILESKGYQAADAGKNNIGLYRVAYARLENGTEANQMLEKIRSSENADAWLLVE